MDTLRLIVELALGVLIIPTVRHLIEREVRRTASPPRATPPWPLRAAAFSCWLVGQLALPLAGALLLALSVGPGGFRHFSVRPVTAVGLVWDGALLTLLALSVWCATLVWRAGNALVMGDRALADLRTRRAALVVAAVGAVPIVGLAYDGLQHPSY